MSLTRYERETIINFNEEDDDVSVYTRSKTMMTKMDKLVKKFPDTFKINEEFEEGREYICHKKYVSIRPPRALSDKHKTQLSQRFKNTLKK